jgi:hypothetical protein
MNANESNQGGLSRRAVIAGLAPLVVPRHVLGGADYQAPSGSLLPTSPSATRHPDNLLKSHDL